MVDDGRGGDPKIDVDKTYEAKESHMSWDYAELSKSAKNAGGPSSFVGTLLGIGLTVGLSAGVALGSTFVLAVQKMMKYKEEAAADTVESSNDKKEIEE